MRTTVNLDATILQRLKRLAHQQRKTLGELISELLAVALDAQDDRREDRRLTWTSKAMGARVDLEDKEALYKALEER